MNDHEKDRIAAALNQARPDWPIKSIRTLLDRPKLADRPRRDVFVALAWVACEPGTATPARVLEAGPWWRAAAVDAPTNTREPFDASVFCGTCGEPEQRCRLRWSGDHEFETVAHARLRKGSVDVTPVVAELKDHVRPPTPPQERTVTT